MDLMWCLLSGQAAVLSGPRLMRPLGHASSLFLLVSSGNPVWSWACYAWACQPLYDMAFSHFGILFVESELEKRPSLGHLQLLGFPCVD